MEIAGIKLASPRRGDCSSGHKAKVPSGGQLTDIDIGASLSGDRRHPEHQALLQLIGTLVGSDLRRIARRRR
jgi:hypothetical protein